MKLIPKIFALGVLAAGAVTCERTALAQVEGYQFGTGLDYAYKYGGIRGRRFDRSVWGLPIAPTPRVDEPPFFALYPPVYYSPDIVYRSYGVSPYAAPPGITPVEMMICPPTPVIQKNPYYSEPDPQSQPETLPPAENSTDPQTT
jgi:hypothetical protein